MICRYWSLHGWQPKEHWHLACHMACLWQGVNSFSIYKAELTIMPCHKGPHNILSLLCLHIEDDCHIHANSDTSPICSDASPLCSNVSPTNSDISPISSDVSPTNSNISPPNSYSVPPVCLARFCHTFRYIPCFLPVTYLSPCCYLLLPCVYPFHVFPPLMCFSYSAFLLQPCPTLGLIRLLQSHPSPIAQLWSLSVTLVIITQICLC